MESSSRVSRIRNRELERLRGPPWLKVVKDCITTHIVDLLKFESFNNGA